MMCLQNTNSTSKTVILTVLAFKRNSTHLHWNQPKLSPVSESSTHPLYTKLCMLFPAHLQARELCPQTYSLLLPLEWSQVTYIPASIKLGRANCMETAHAYNIQAMISGNAQVSVHSSPKMSTFFLLFDLWRVLQFPGTFVFFIWLAFQWCQNCCNLPGVYSLHFEK